MPLDDDIASTFIGARDQDNEALAFQDELVSARAKDSEQSMVAITKGLEEKSAVPAGEVEPLVTDPIEKPDMLPDAEGKLEPVTERTDEDNFMEMFSDAPRVVGEIAANLPKNFTAGTLRAAKEAVDAVIPHGLERSDAALVDLGFGDYVESVNGFMAEIENGGGTGDNVVQELAQFAVPFSGYMKMLGATTKMTMLPKAMTADAFASFFNLDPHMERLSGVLAEVGVHNEFVSYLADETGTDTENRFRNVLENQALGGALGGTIFAMAKAFKGVMWTGKNMARQVKDVGWDGFLKTAGVAGAVVAAPEEAGAGTWGEGILGAIQSRKAATEEALGDGVSKKVGKGAKQKQKPKETRSDEQILMSLPDAVFMDWQGGADAKTPIKDFLHKKYPNLVGAK